MQNPELSAAYERIEELETVMQQVLDNLVGGNDCLPLVVVDRCIDMASEALADRVLAA